SDQSNSQLMPSERLLQPLSSTAPSPGDNRDGSTERGGPSETGDRVPSEICDGPVGPTHADASAEQRHRSRSGWRVPDSRLVIPAKAGAFICALALVMCDTAAFRLTSAAFPLDAGLKAQFGSQ